MKQKVLVIATKIPETFENKRDKRLLRIIETLSTSFEVHLVYVQSLFVKEESIQRITGRGVKVMPLQEIKNSGRSENAIASFLKDRKYAIVLFNNYFTAKYYLPLFHVHSPDTVVVVDAGKSQYISEIKYAREFKESYKQISILKNAEHDKMKEIAIYNNADVVIVEDASSKEQMSGDVPNIDVRVISGWRDDASGNMLVGRETDAAFSVLKKRIIPDPGMTDFICVRSVSSETLDIVGDRYGEVRQKDVAEVHIHIDVDRNDSHSLVAGYNSALRMISGKYGLIFPGSSVFPKISAERMLFCALSHPRNGIVIPLSNADINATVRRETLPEFVAKHYGNHFGSWHDVKQMKGPCFLVKKELVDMVGVLDERFMTLDYALFDFSLKAFQAGYKTILNSESFIYCDELIKDRKEDVDNDRRFLFEKWGGAGMVFLNGIEGDSAT